MRSPTTSPRWAFEDKKRFGKFGCGQRPCCEASRNSTTEWKMCPLPSPCRWLFFFVLCCVFCGCSLHAPAQKAPASRLLIAFGSYRDRPKHPNIFFYEHDGIGSGKIVGKVGTERNNASAE